MSALATALAATAIFTQIQLKYGAERADFLHRWYERPLHQDTSWAAAGDGSFLNIPAWRKTAETLRLGGMDGVAFFAAKRDQRWDVFAKSLMPGGETALLLELSNANGMEGYMAAAERALAAPNHYRIDGKVVLPVRYASEACSPEFCAKLKAALMERFGDRFIVMPYGVVFPRDDFNGGKPSEEAFGRAREGLRKVLRAGDGFFYQGREGVINRRFDRAVFEATVVKVLKEVYAEDEFRGKRFGTWCNQGHENDYRWQYVLDSNGTATLCDRLEAVVPLKPDLIICCEWDEENENSHFRPTVSNGFTTQRIMRHFADRLAGRAPAPFPGDDTSLPNLVVSYRKALVAGEPVEVEVRNIPDGTFAGETFRVSFAWLGADGAPAKSYPAQTLAAGEMAAVRFVSPVTELLEHRTLTPAVTVEWSAGRREFKDGFYPLGLNAVRNLDHKWFRHALRDMPAGVAGALEIGERDGHGVYTVRGRVSSPVALRSVEVLDDMDTAYLHGETPGVPAGCERIRVEFSGLRIDKATDVVNGTIRFRNAPGAVLHPFGNRKSARLRGIATVEGTAWTFKNCHCDNWGALLWATVPSAEMDSGEIDIDLPPHFKGTVKLADLLDRDAVGFNSVNGRGLTVMRYLPPLYLPPPLTTNEVEFTFRWKPLEPTSVLRLQTVDARYRVWNGPARTVYRPSGRMAPLSVFDRESCATSTISVDAARLPSIACDLSGKGGSALSLGGGRALCGMVGAAATLAQAFGKGESQYGNPLHRATKHLKDGKLPAKGWGCLPMQVVPGFAGFELEMAVKPAGFGRVQGLYSSGNCGMDVFIAPDGTVKATLAGGHAFMVTRSGLATAVSGPKLKDGEWNAVRLVTDRRTAWLEVDGVRGEAVPYRDYLFNQRYTLFGASHPKGDLFAGELGRLSVKYR